MSPPADHTLHIASLLARDEGKDLLWQPADLPGLLRHQMASALAGSLAESAATDVFHAYPELVTFADLFLHPSPPVELLKLVKDFAKCRRQRESLPREIDMVLYLAAIGAAKAKCDISISAISAAELDQQFLWAKAQPWICEPLVSLFDSIARGSTDGK